MEKSKCGVCHLGGGIGAETDKELRDALAEIGGGSKLSFQPWLGGPFSKTVNWLAFKGGPVGYGASLLKVFWPYLDWNTVFDNSRVVQGMGEAPAKFSSYADPLLQFSRVNKFKYPAKSWPADAARSVVVTASGAGA